MRFSFFFFNKLFIYLFLAVFGLHFCARAFSSCGERGPLFIAVRGPLTIVPSLVAEHRLQTRRLSSCGSRAQSWHVGSSQTRAWTRVPCIGRQILNHCATREAPKINILIIKQYFRKKKAAIWKFQYLSKIIKIINNFSVWASINSIFLFLSRPCS